MKSIEDKTLEEILLLANKTDELNYFQELSNLGTNRISRQIVERMQGHSIVDIRKKIEAEELMLTSINFFPGELVLLYPNFKELHTRNYLTCDFSGALIRPKGIYIYYRPLIENLTTNTTYVLKKSIKVEPGYIYDLPDTITELEQLEQNMKLGMKNNQGIDYSHFNSQMNGSLVLQKLNRRK